MATGTHTQTNFTAGEISPELLGRSDLNRYGNGLFLLRNFIPKKHGGVSNRPGTRFVAATKYSGTALDTIQCCAEIGDTGIIDEDAATFTDTIRARLIPFQFSVEQSFIIEIGDFYMRFFKDDGQILSAGVPYEITTPYGGSVIDAIKFTQSADVLYLCHPDHPPRQLNRIADDNWTLTKFDFKDGPYAAINPEDDKFMEVDSITPGTVTLTASGAGWGGVGPFVTEYNRTVNQPGLLVRLNTSGTQWGWGEIITVAAGGFTATFDLVDPPLDAATPTANWRFCDWNGLDGWPWVPAFHQNRLWFGGRNGLPQTFWASTSGNFVNYQPSDLVTGVVDDADALRFTINDDQVNAIRWMISTAKGLLIGSSGGEFVVASNSPTSGISPTNVDVQRQSNRGSKPNPRPAQVGNAALFVQRHGRKLREMVFRFETDQHESPDLTLVAEHITADRLRWISYMAEPQPILWASDEAGGLLSMTYEREQEVVAWARHKLGGKFETGDPFIESIAVVPEDDFDRLWVIVKRTIDGKEVRYVEFITDPFETGDTLLRDAVFLDSTLTYDGWNTTICNQLILEPGDESSSSSGSSSSSSSSSSSGSSSSSSGSSSSSSSGVPVNWSEDAEGYLRSLCWDAFTPASVGRVYRFNATPDGEYVTPIDVEVLEYISSTQVKVRFLNDIPTSLQAVAVWEWALTISIVTGFEHLEGETVGLLVDGAVHANVTVVNGEIDLTLGSQATEFKTYAGVVHAGLPYNSDLVTMPLVPELGFDSRGRQKSAYKTHIRFHQAVGSLFGPNLNRLDAIPFREGDAVQGQHVRLFTGTKTIAVEGSYDTDVQVALRQRDPLPVTVLSMTHELDINAV